MKDSRGFKIYGQFRDTYDSLIRVKQSSSVSKRCWIFVEGGEISENNGSIHISESQAKELIKYLEKFVKDN